MSAFTVRLWRRGEEWEASVGDRPEGGLRAAALKAGVVASFQPLSRAGMCWDEAIERLVYWTVAPGAAAYRDAPGSDGWEMLLEVEPVEVGAFRVSVPSGTWDHLTFGEMLAQVVFLTFPRSWGGFGRSVPRALTEKGESDGK